MKKVFILGHKGMLGNAVLKYFLNNPNFIVQTTNSRFPDDDFLNKLSGADTEFIVNCIGKIPQKQQSSDEKYDLINIKLPEFLETLGKKVIHPSTDCEFSGLLESSKQYSKSDPRDAQDEYGRSKAQISEKIEKNFKNTKIIRVSIIGHESGSKVSLLEWFLSQRGAVNGYINHFWNGITTLEWAKKCEQLINYWDSYPILNQFGTAENKSKYHLLCLIREVYGKNISVNEFSDKKTINKCLLSDLPVKNVKDQLIELRDFYSR